MLDSFVKNFGIITTILTLVGSAIAFFVQRGHDLEQRKIQTEAVERESKKVFLNKQADFYFETSAVVSRIANSNIVTILPKDAERFWQLYWGELSMVEDLNVEHAMVLFGRSLTALQHPGTNEHCAQSRQEISLILAHCIRESLAKSWGVTLGTLSDNRCTESKFDAIREICPSEKQERLP
jgi:hypothetical protein